jgi:hypothetical protein
MNNTELIFCIKFCPSLELSIITGSAVAKVEYQKTIDLGYDLDLELISQVETFLKDSGFSLKDFSKIFVYSGPGSFTALRIGSSFINALNYGADTKLDLYSYCGQTEEDKDWQLKLLEGVTLNNIKPTKLILPFYYQEAIITKPKV